MEEYRILKINDKTEQYKVLQREINKELKRTKSERLREKCENIEQTEKLHDALT